jgi:UDP-N-acetylmuramoylalanine--D-glutamate ligase
MSCSHPKDQPVFRPTGFADLANRRVGIFGYGVEGRASARRLAGTGAHVVLVDDAPGLGPDVLVTTAGGHDALLACDVVLKSPGIARRRADILDLESHGVTVTSSLNLWLHDTDRSRVAAITGTKGKSTTTALVTFFLRCLGEAAQSLGNMGLPPYDPSVDTSTGWLIVEVSSYQCVDVDIAPGLVVVTALGVDHLDWHGSVEQYQDDKLSLTRASGPHRTLVPDTPTFRGLAGRLGGEVGFIAADSDGLAARLGLVGAHNDGNVALALAAASSLTGAAVADVRSAVQAHATEFVPLRGRLTLVASETVNDALVRFVDDGLATAPLPVVAALEVFAREPVALIAGGFDRGVDYAPLVDALTHREAPTLVLTMGDAGRRIGEAIGDRSPVQQRPVQTMGEAVRQARDFLTSGGVVLLSPGAPSFGQYRNWEERSDDFTNAVLALTR